MCVGLRVRVCVSVHLPDDAQDACLDRRVCLKSDSLRVKKFPCAARKTRRQSSPLFVLFCFVFSTLNSKPDGLVSY